MHLAAGIRTREAENRDEVEGVVANTLNLFRNGAVGFIDLLDVYFANRTGVN
jgi:hypothetical protein